MSGLDRAKMTSGGRGEALQPSPQMQAGRQSDRNRSSTSPARRERNTKSRKSRKRRKPHEQKVPQFAHAAVAQETHAAASSAVRQSDRRKSKGTAWLPHEREL